jgi:hypothetical protein
MRFRARAVEPVAWKNGGGSTRELAVSEHDGRMVWRLSLADIDRDGPFSRFPGLTRIHVIVEGRGHVLTGDDQRLEARPLAPLIFAGDAALTCTLVAGPCRAFNVIYDPTQVAAEARVVTDGPLSQVAGGEHGLFVVAGTLELAGLGRLSAGEGLVTRDLAAGAITGTVIHVWFSRPRVSADRAASGRARGETPTRP